MYVSVEIKGRGIGFNSEENRFISMFITKEICLGEGAEGWWDQWNYIRHIKMTRKET